MQRLRRKTAIFIDASMGIGEAIARRFSQESANVTIEELFSEAGKVANESITWENGSCALFVKIDVTDQASVRHREHIKIRKLFGQQSQSIRDLVPREQYSLLVHTNNASQQVLNAQQLIHPSGYPFRRDSLSSLGMLAQQAPKIHVRVKHPGSFLDKTQ